MHKYVLGVSSISHLRSASIELHHRKAKENLPLEIKTVGSKEKSQKLTPPKPLLLQQIIDTKGP